MDRKEARKNLLKYHEAKARQWFALAEKGLSFTEALSAVVEPSVAIYEPTVCPHAALLLIEELREHGIKIDCLITNAFDSTGLGDKYGIPCVAMDELQHRHNIDFIITLSEKGLYGDQSNLMQKNGAEVVSLWGLLELVYFVDVGYRPITGTFGDSVKVCVLQWPLVTDFKNSRLYEGVYKGPFSPKDYQANPERFKKLYSDIAEYSPEYIRKIFEELPIINRGGEVQHVDYRSDYVNVVDGRRFTPDQPEESNGGIFIYGGCIAFGVGADDRYTIPSNLQKHVNQYYGSMRKSEYTVYNLGRWGVSYHPFDSVRSSKKNKKIYIYIARGDISYSREKNEKVYAYIEKTLRNYGMDCFDLAPVLGKVEEEEGTYLDITHVNHRGYRAVARAIFSDYIKPILDAEASIEGTSLSQISSFSLPSKWEALNKAGYSLSEFLIRGGVESVAIQCSDTNKEETASLLRELKKHAIPVKYLVTSSPNCFSFEGCDEIKFVDTEELPGVEKVDIMITMPDDGFSGVDMGMHGVAATEIIPFDALVNLVFDRHFYYPRSLEKFARHKVYACLLQWPHIRDLGINAIEKSGFIHKAFSEEYAQSNYGYYSAYLYNDIAGISPNYLKEIFQGRPVKSEKCGTRHADCKGKFVNIANGNRRTVNQPTTSDKSIYVFGDGVAFGAGVEDKYTLASLLQEQINNSGKQLSAIPACRVVNEGLWFEGASDEYVLENKILPKLEGGEIKEGDIVLWILDKRYPLTEKNKTALTYLQETLEEYGVSSLDLSQALQLVQESKKVYVDSKHVNHRGHKAVATKVYFDFLKGVFDGRVQLRAQKSPLEVIESEPDWDDALNREFVEYLAYLTQEKVDVKDSVGAIVMNCNPFTKGHRYLVEKAAGEVDFLYIFIVEEDRSVFKFEDRFKLATEGLKDLKNVKVLKSGKFIISTITFPDYFTKDSAKQVAVDTSLDIKLFIKHIVPALGIGTRFVGNEPLCPVTRQYNKTMKEALPQHGIKFVEYERVERDDEPISASRVRALLKDQKFEEMRALVPESTYDYLVKEYSAV